MLFFWMLGLPVWGCEVDRSKLRTAVGVLDVLFSMEPLPYAVRHLSVTLEARAVEETRLPPGAAVAYSFWEGQTLKAGMGAAVSACPSVRLVAVVQRGVRGGGAALALTMQRRYGFPALAFAASLPVYSHGSGRAFTCFVFRRG